MFVSVGVSALQQKKLLNVHFSGFPAAEDRGQRYASTDSLIFGTVSDIRPSVEVLASEPDVQLCSSDSEVWVCFLQEVVEVELLWVLVFQPV